MWYRIVVLMAAILFVLPNLAVAQSPLQEMEGGTILAEGFNGPQGITVDADGNLWVIESGMGGDDEIQYLSLETGEPAPTTMGPTARIVMLSPDGTQSDTAALPSIKASDMEHVGGARLVWLDGVLYATSGAWLGGLGDSPDLVASVVRVEGSEVTQVADLWAFEEANNPDGFKLESHPYGIAVGPDGWLWVAEFWSQHSDAYRPGFRCHRTRSDL